MSLRKSKGQMYPWVTHTHTHLGGQCPHECVYCYVDSPRFGRPARYQGPLRLIEEEFKVNYGSGKTIFMENCNDLFASDVPIFFADRIFDHCLRWPENTYVWQSKNPARFRWISSHFPDNSIFGTTIETNRIISPEISKAPSTYDRVWHMRQLQAARKFVTIEPVMDFDVDILAGWIDQIRPEFLNLGADSKGHNLPEPSIDKIEAFVRKLAEYGIELREKHNLNRLRSQS